MSTVPIREMQADTSRDVGRSLAQDRRRKAKSIDKPGQGDRAPGKRRAVGKKSSV